MPTTAIQEVHLEFTFDFNGSPVDASCQIIDAQIVLPGTAAGTRTEVACPDGVVMEPGASQNGALTGNAFVDPADTGLTWALATLYQGLTEFTYTLTYYADQAATVAIKFSGSAVVNSFTLPFGPKPNKAKFPIDIGLVTAVMARPA